MNKGCNELFQKILLQSVVNLLQSVVRKKQTSQQRQWRNSDAERRIQ